ncbi:MAG: hypoxanthine phosphoribosyltransferase [Planctomycetes bacterium]|nr:hypoxanthine phosphoribosyltransferase [Planctomycetota bacterium]
MQPKPPTKATPEGHVRVLIPADKIRLRTAQLGRQISKDFAGRELVVVCVLKGAFVFTADLVRRIDVPVTCDFLRVSSYESGTVSSGQVRFEFDLTQPITGKHVILVEDIVDTGLTMDYLLETLRARHPASLKVCSLLHKPERSKVHVPIDYLGFTIPNEFVIGYGLDYEGKFRGLPYIGVMTAPRGKG